MNVKTTRAKGITALFRTPKDTWEGIVPPPAPDTVESRGLTFRKVGHFWIQRGELACAYEPAPESVANLTHGD